MLDLKQGLARSNHFCTSANPLMYKSNGTTCVSPKATDSFDFWGDQRSNKYDRYDHTVGDEEVESFQTRSTPLWKKIRSNNIGGYEISPLLPNNHHYSSPSPTSRLQAIIDGRRELMEMIQDMPESCYELSLKDMVDDHDDDDQVSHHHHQGVQVEEEVKKIKPKNKKKRNSTGIRGPISRCESMDSGVFLLKMFFPISLSSKKKSTSKLSRRSSFEGSEKPVHKDWWKMGFSSAGESKSSARSTSSSSRSSSSNSNSSSRSAGNNFTSSRWSFPIKKCKSTGQPGCFF